MGLTALSSMFVYAQAFEWVGWLMRVIVRSVEGYGLYSVASAVVAVLVMFPAAFFAGMTLPLLTLALLRQGRGEKVIGQVYAFNTLGAIVGVLAAVHVLMPVFGLKYALLIAAVVDMGLGVWLLAGQWGSGSGASDDRRPAEPSFRRAAGGCAGRVLPVRRVAVRRVGNGDTALARTLAERHWEQLGPDARASGRLRLVTYMAA